MVVRFLRYCVGIPLASAVCLSLLLTGASDAAPYFPLCESAASDSSGDGWGWENSRSCRVAGGVADSASAVAKLEVFLFAVCQSSASDPDGDGYGWENNASCVVEDASVQSSHQIDNVEYDFIYNFPVCSAGVTDSDGDGYGFENGQSCEVKLLSNDSTSVASDFPVCSSVYDPDGDGYGYENGRSCTVQNTGNSAAEIQSINPAASQAPVIASTKAGEITVDDITDLVLVTGQSNVLASGTSYDASQDQPNTRVLAYTNSGWEQADLFQSWDRFQHPGNHAATTPNRQPNNSFAFHFGKTLVERDASRVVGVIVVPGPGLGISSWDAGASIYNLISGKVARALADIPQKFSIDAVLWHQGENDWLYEGTSDANPTGFSSENSYEYRNYYQIKLDALISNIRNESWAKSDAAFICGETRRAEGVNRRLNALNSDSDSRTACVKATDLPARADDPFGSHFSGAGLRTLGQRYADAYLNMK